MAEAGRRDLAVEKVPTGDVRLHGGRALYDPDALLIVHEDVDNEFAHAFLVAHKAGHVEFGGYSEASVTTAVDPTRPAEAAPVGIDRVVDFGRRERREVQMDLFAREFLLPRSIAPSSPDERKTASQIAERLRAPFDVIASQLLDALLLPRVEPSAADGAGEKPLNAEQARAAAHRGTPYIVRTAHPPPAPGKQKFYQAGWAARRPRLDRAGDRKRQREAEMARTRWLHRRHANGGNVPLTRRSGRSSRTAESGGHPTIVPWALGVAYAPISAVWLPLAPSTRISHSVN